VIGLLLALYPSGWRRRYGEEFRAVLESRPIGPFDVADVLLGALDARLTLRVDAAPAANGGQLPMLRIGGVGAIVGPALTFVGIAGASASGEEGGATPWMLLVVLGTLALLLALAGLSGFQAHREPRLAWAAFGIPAFGALMSLVGLSGMAQGTEVGWSIWALGMLMTVVGSVLFAVATIRAAVFSRGASIALAASSVIVILVVSGVASGMGEETTVLRTALAIGAWAASWIALGISALRRGPIRTLASA
jgi:hypothetical protein